MFHLLQTSKGALNVRHCEALRSNLTYLLGKTASFLAVTMEAPFGVFGLIPKQ